MGSDIPLSSVGFPGNLILALIVLLTSFSPLLSFSALIEYIKKIYRYLGREGDEEKDTVVERERSYSCG